MLVLPDHLGFGQNLVLFFTYSINNKLPNKNMELHKYSAYSLKYPIP